MGAIVGYSGPEDQSLTTSMLNSLRHRGGTNHQIGQSPTGVIGYLSPIKPATQHPLAGLHQEEHHTIALAGFLTSSPYRTLPELFQAYRHHGPDVVQQLRGAYILAIWDDNTLFLVRDGAGQRTVYWSLDRGRLLFAVEPKGIWQSPGFSRKLRPAAVVQYLTFSFLPGPGTMLENLHELQPGHWLRWEMDVPPKIHRYFHFEQPPPVPEQTEADWVADFRHTFARAIRERLPDGDRFGVFLSGGIDSSIVTAELARHHSGRLKTYAIHFGKDYPNELDFARAVAHRVGTDHQEVHIRPQDFLPRLRQILWYLDDPIGDPITVPNFELARHVSGDLDWVFNGEGGDPCFGGPKNIPMLLQHWYGGIDRDEHFREKGYLASYRRCYDDLEQMLTPEWRRQIDFDADLTGILKPFFQSPHPSRFLDKLSALNIRLKGAHLILPKVERMLAACGLIPLSPLFDEEIIRFSFAMPARLRLSGGVEKVILKRAYADDLPPEVIARPKSGMRVPVHYWFQKEMRQYARKILAPRIVREVGIFDPNRVRQLLDYNIEEGPGRYGLRLWMLLTLEIWRRIVIEGEPI